MSEKTLTDVFFHYGMPKPPPDIDYFIGKGSIMADDIRLVDRVQHPKVVRHLKQFPWNEQLDERELGRYMVVTDVVFMSSDNLQEALCHLYNELWAFHEQRTGEKSDLVMDAAFMYEERDCDQCGEMVVRLDSHIWTRSLVVCSKCAVRNSGFLGRTKKSLKRAWLNCKAFFTRPKAEKKPEDEMQKLEEECRTAQERLAAELHERIPTDPHGEVKIPDHVAQADPRDFRGFPNWLKQKLGMDKEV